MVFLNFLSFISIQRFQVTEPQQKLSPVMELLPILLPISLAMLSIETLKLPILCHVLLMTLDTVNISGNSSSNKMVILEATTTVAPLATTAPEFETLSNLIPNLATCDASNQRIVGGTSAVANTWPWIVRLLFQTADMVAASSTSYYACGGTIIDENWVLTAAHCCTSQATGSVVNMKKVIMKFGEHQKTVAENGEFEAIIDDLTNYMHVHPSYTTTSDGSSTNYDVCLINIPNGTNGMGDGLFTVAAQAGYASSVARVCMPSAPAEHGDACWVAGWGTMSFGGESADILQSVGVNIFSNDYCIANSIADMSSVLQTDEVCAGAPDSNSNNLVDGGIDSCQGDSGGPLICDINGAATLTGIVSWGYECAAEGKPGVYGRVYDYLSWIETTTALTLPTPPTTGKFKSSECKVEFVF